MNIEEQLRQSNELLKQLLSHTAPIDEDETKQNQEEIDDIDESIERYEAEVQELTEKLANEDNYKRTKSDFELNERPIIIELLAESTSLEREEIFKSNQTYRKQQEQQTKMLGIYSEEISKLKEEIGTIEARLNKDAIAKNRNIAKKLHLSDSEVEELQAELAYKQELIIQGNEVMEICADEIRRYGKLIIENNNRLKGITEKEQRLADLLSAREKEPKSELDQYRIRLDKDELAKKNSVLEALKNRKAFLLYNPVEEIRKQIKQNEEYLNSISIKKENDDELIKDTSISNGIDEFTHYPKTEDPTISSVFNGNYNFESETMEDDKQNDILETTFVDKSDKEEINDQESLQTTIEDNSSMGESEKDEFEKLFEPVIDNYMTGADNDIVENEEDLNENKSLELIEIKDAPEKLKKQKVSERIKNAWKKWRTNVIAAAVAAAITISAGSMINSSKTDDNKYSGEESDLNVTEQENTVIDNNDVDYTVEEKEPQTTVEESVVPESKPVELPIQPEVSNPEIPDVEIEQQPVNNQELTGVINNSEIETTILQTEGDFVEIPLANGETIYVKYGDNGENIPEEITIKYVGTDMYIYSPIVSKKVL